VKQHVAALDGLRGVAVAAVVGYHLRPELVPGGFLGVDLFFVLSGYLITSLLLEEHRSTGRIDLLAFAGRRVRRLLPAVVVVVVAVTAYISVRGDLGEIERIRRHALATLGYVANWLFIVDGDSYFADTAGPSMLRHVWSLAVEEQFYLLWPLLAWVALRASGRRAVGVLALILAIVSVGRMAALFDGGDPSRAYFGTDTRLFEPLIGAFGAVLLPLRAPRPRALNRAGSLAVVVWLGAVFVVDDAWSGFYRGGALALGLIALLAVMGDGGVAARLLGSRVLVGLGAISYAVYLWHWPLLLILRREGWRGVPLDLAVIAATLVLSVASLWLVERPARRRTGRVGDWMTGIRPLAVSLVVIALAGGVVVALTRTSVPADAVTVEEALAAITAEPGPVTGSTEVPDDVTATVDPAPGATDSTPELPITVMLVGDSSAWTMGGGTITFDPQQSPYISPFDGTKVTLLNLARQGYRLVPGATTDLGGVRQRPDEDIDTEAWWQETATVARPDAIVVYVGFSDIQSRIIDGAEVAFASERFDEEATAAAEQLFAALAAEAPVVVLTAPPLVGADMVVPEMAEFFDEESPARAAHLNSLLEQVADRLEGVSIFDFASALCPGDTVPETRDGCRLAADGEPARFDGLHYSAAGGELAAELLTDAVIRSVELSFLPEDGRP
jgi:peptidoglycan/LPS O-acetylase OafA/YrhL/lysophospholipase L1-like esterase